MNTTFIWLLILMTIWVRFYLINIFLAKKIQLLLTIDLIDLCPQRTYWIIGQKRINVYHDLTG